MKVLMLKSVVLKDVKSFVQDLYNPNLLYNYSIHRYFPYKYLIIFFYSYNIYFKKQSNIIFLHFVHIFLLQEVNHACLFLMKSTFLSNVMSREFHILAKNSGQVLYRRNWYILKFEYLFLYCVRWRIPTKFEQLCN